MIIKSNEINKINLDSNFYFLLHGKNEGHKKEVINTLLKNQSNNTSYDEKEILENSNNFLENLYTKSFFEKEKIIIIRRASDKILNIFKEIFDKHLEDVIIIIFADILDKKSKLRSFFEKNKNCISIPFYNDNNQTLSRFALAFLREKKINISQSNINLIIDRCNEDRETLINELQKIEFLSKTRDNITFEDINKLTNLIENHSISSLIDNCLAKNEKKILKIFNENNFSSDDCILIIRSFLKKSKTVLKLCEEFEKNNNLNLTIEKAKPPIFWKDKEITKQQINSWNSKNIKNLIYKLNDLELSAKKNFNISVNILTDFILQQSSKKTNN